MLQQLKQQIDQCMAADVPRLQTHYRQLVQRQTAGKPIDQGLARLSQHIEASLKQSEQRRSGLPVPEYQLALPVSDRREEILHAIDKHQIIVLCGETGSGKTTQLPKLCLELGRGTRGKIGHTQPRRIAARSLATRIAEELHSEVGQARGLQGSFPGSNQRQQLYQGDDRRHPARGNAFGSRVS